MVKIRRKWPQVIFGLVCLGFAAAFVFGKYEFTRSEPEIQEIVEGVLPVEHSGV